MTMESKCEIIIFWSAEDDAYVAEVPELPGCMAEATAIKRPFRTPKRSSRSGSTRPENWDGLRRHAGVLLCVLIMLGAIRDGNHDFKTSRQLQALSAGENAIPLSHYS